MGFFILFRILFVVCMIFVLGYVFGPFAKNDALRTITRVAAVLAVILFIASNVFFFRFARGMHGGSKGHYHCNYYDKDSTRENAIPETNR